MTTQREIEMANEPVRYDGDVPVWAVNEKGQAICGYKLRNGKPCRQRRSLSNNGRCHQHLGTQASKPPTEQPAFEPGSRSAGIANSLPKNLRRAFEDSVLDPDQLSLTNEIGVMDANLVRLRETIEKNVDPASWQLLRDLHHNLGVALEQVDEEQISAIYDTISNILQRGSRDSEVWRELQTAMMQRTKMVEVDAKRRNMAKSVMPIRDAETLMVVWFRILFRHVSSPEILRNFKRDFENQIKLPYEHFARKAVEANQTIEAEFEDADTEIA